MNKIEINDIFCWNFSGSSNYKIVKANTFYITRISEESYYITYLDFVQSQYNKNSFRYFMKKELVYLGNNLKIIKLLYD